MEIFDFKCKYCGGELSSVDGLRSVGKCKYCGSKQTLPKLYDERRANLFSRANHMRRNNEFDKAEGLYEQILNEDPSDPEAYWSLVLCRFGIEYVEDAYSHERKPTVNRAQMTSIFADENYKSAIKYADSDQKKLYEREAKAINEIQKGILEISRKEEPFDVFICYKETDENGKRSLDSVLAYDLYRELTRDGYKVFFARETLHDKTGSAYEPYIFSALNSAKVMVVFGTKKEHFEAVWVRNEWSRFLGQIKKGKKKVLFPVYRDMDAYDLPQEFANLQALDMSRLGYLQELISGVENVVNLYREKEGLVTAESIVKTDSKKKRTKKPRKEKKRRKAPIIAAIITVLLAIAFCTAGFFILQNGDADLTEEHIHSIQIDAPVASTCTETGFTGGSHCKVCNEVIVAQKRVDALGHQVETYRAVSPTCTETGLTAGSYCSRCNETLTDQKPIDALGHDWNDDYFCNVCNDNRPTSLELKYKLIIYDTEYEVSGIGSCSDKEVVILNTYNGKPITSIGEQAFIRCSNLTSIYIPKGVSTIGSLAFSDCTGLTSVEIPSSVKIIGDFAFDCCKNLTSITYNGTKAEWNAISKGTSWNSNTGEYIVYCTDGEISK